MVHGAKVWNFQIIDFVFNFLPNAREQLRMRSLSKENQGLRLLNPRQVKAVATNTIVSWFYYLTRTLDLWLMRVSYVRSKDAHKI